MAAAGAGRRTATAVAAVCVGLAVYLLVSGLGVGDSKRAKPPAPRAQDLYAVFSLESPHVLSTYSIYSTRGLGADLQPSFPTARSVLGASAVANPVARYKRYAIAQLGTMELDVARLQAALAGGDVASAKSAWRSSYASYLRLGGVYLTGRVASLNQAIDGLPGGLAGGVSNPRFEGLHRIEYGLWTGQAPQSLLPSARRLGAAVQRLRALLPRVTLTTLEYGTRAHEILEDALRDLLSGADVPWSEEGVLATDSGLTATEEIIATLHPFLFDEESESANVAPAVEAELASLKGVFESLAAAHNGRLPTNGELTQRQSEQLDGTLGGALEALSRVPVVLEAERPLGDIAIPPADVRIDP